MSARDLGQIKGSAIREFALWYEATWGRGYAPRVIARVPERAREVLWAERAALGLVASEWYPCEVVHALLDAVAEGRSDAEMQALIEQGTAHVVRRMSRGLYQFLFRMVGSPGLYARHIQRAWRTLHTTGERRLALDVGVADSYTESWDGHHRWLCVITTETMRHVFEAMGCRDVQVERVRCVSMGDSSCHAVLRYVEPR